jgi:hypothetical protein
MRMPPRCSLRPHCHGHGIFVFELRLSQSCWYPKLLPRVTVERQAFSPLLFDSATLTQYRIRYAISVLSLCIIKYRSAVRIDTDLTNADFCHCRTGAHQHREAPRAPKLLTTRKIDIHHPCWESGEDASALILSWEVWTWVSCFSGIQSRYRGLEPRPRDHRPPALKSATPHRGFLSGGCLGRAFLLC